ncbi:hypothetical protein ABIA22_005785 [Sinorhizobium fredii]|nr:hypothetical protein AB395_00006315 [Sinorhizobium fredii CCBAU 45436]
MRTRISFTISPSDRARQTALIRNRNTPQKHVWRVAFCAERWCNGRNPARQV